MGEVLGFRSDARLIGMAMRKRWDIPDDVKRDTIAAVVAIQSSVESSDRDRLAASKIILAAEKQNQDDEHKQTDIDRDNAKRCRLVALAARLGIAESVVLDAEATARGRIEDDGGGSLEGGID
jgi:hypothetical protein